MFHRLGFRCAGLLAAAGLLSSWVAAESAAGPVLLDDRFELPAGFHVYRAASPELTGGSYDITFDGEGRLLVGDGNAIRRLRDTDNDGVYDEFEGIASGLGWRGPQGLLVQGDRLYAVGGDGLQLYDGYKSGRIVHRGRLGQEFKTGGDHDLHTILRGHDGWLYLMAGNGAGIEGRKHITEANSPMLWEREASVFRLDPEGKHWECIAAGGRNPPGLGQNYLGELFSFDSDMEWHVGLPWYKPVRLSHWAVGSDHGWQEVGAYPNYFIDGVNPVMEAGRGSPNWGAFYEHNQYPTTYRNAFLVCDYRSKRESNDQYATTGRLVSFFLERDGAGWKARMEVLARPKPGARDAQDRPVNFALVDLEVAPDGSLLLSDHNQGLWRIFYDPKSAKPHVPKLVPDWPLPGKEKPKLMETLLELPQPLAEWSRVREEAIRESYGDSMESDLRGVSLNRELALSRRLRAIQLLAREFSRLDESWLRTLAGDPEPEIRGQAVWLLGLRGDAERLPLLLSLFEDRDPFVRRRVAESLTRFKSAELIPQLIDHMGDTSRLTRFICMNALAHYPTREWFEKAISKPASQIRMRALVASLFRQELPAPEAIRRLIRSLMESMTPASSIEDRLDLLRVLALVQKTLESNLDSKQAVADFLLAGFPADDRHVRWEQVRLLGLFGIEQSFRKLLELVKTEPDPVTQFHIGQSLARMTGGWTDAEEESAMSWFEGTQRGWFAELGTKGVEFPESWATVLSDFATRHREVVMRHAKQIQVHSLLGSALIELLIVRDPTGQALIEYYSKQTRPGDQAKVGLRFRNVPHPAISKFLREELTRTKDPSVHAALLQGLAGQPKEEANVPVLIEGLRHADIDIARACAVAVLRNNPSLTLDLVDVCMERLVQSARLFHHVEKLLVTLSGAQRAGFRADLELNRRVDDAVRQAGIIFWKSWYGDHFGRAFVPKTTASSPEKPDEDVLRFILSDASRNGDPSRGSGIYERLQCHTCHGGGAAPGREGHIFGADLAGVTRRLSRAELADALTYPSKQVAERYKAFELAKKDGTLLVGFVTERNDEAVTFVDSQQVHRVARSEIVRLAPQAGSLMPDRLMNTLTDEEARDLLAFLDNIGVSPPRP